MASAGQSEVHDLLSMRSRSMTKFVITVELVRQAKVVIEADDAQDARDKVSNFEFDPDTPGDLIGWRITGSKKLQEQVSAVISEGSALDLARNGYR